MTNESNDLAGSNEQFQTGIEGLDDILAGGLPGECMYLVQGDPGSGKTTLALQFLLEGKRRGENGFYITLSESKRELEGGAFARVVTGRDSAAGVIGGGRRRCSALRRWI